MASEDRTQDYNDDLKRMSNKLGIPTPQSIETPITETSQLSQILSGWGKKMKDNATGEIVTGCGCNISAKSMSPHSSCPLNKWDK